jgi:hypothetical protein
MTINARLRCTTAGHASRGLNHPHRPALEGLPPPITSNIEARSLASERPAPGQHPHASISSAPVSRQPLSPDLAATTYRLQSLSAGGGRCISGNVWPPRQKRASIPTGSPSRTAAPTAAVQLHMQHAMLITKNRYNPSHPCAVSPAASGRVCWQHPLRLPRRGGRLWHANCWFPPPSAHERQEVCPVEFKRASTERTPSIQIISN